ncbi:MAG: energy transducer TonB [Acidobacteriota bacterium]
MSKCLFILFAFLLIAAFPHGSLAQNEDGNYALKVQRIAFPSYPISAIAAGISGDVLVEFEIDKNGEVIETKMLTGHKLLQKAVLSIASLWKFSAGSKNERQIYTFTFSIIPQGLPNTSAMVTFEMPNKITIFGLALKDSVGLPLKSNSKVRID